jgi:hypothetical protein
MIQKPGKVAELAELYKPIACHIEIIRETAALKVSHNNRKT